jgi:hypothetical protein
MFFHEQKLLTLLQKNFGRYTYIFSSDQYESYDVQVLNSDGTLRCFLELKSRSSEACKFVRRDNSILVDESKVNRLSELSQVYRVPCYLVTYLEDRSELTVVEVCTDSGAINPQFRTKKIKANKNTMWKGGKVQKNITFVNLDNCWRKLLA